MKFLSKLFKKRLVENSTSHDEQLKRKREGFNFFQSGQEAYFNKQPIDALSYLDQALEYDFEENFLDYTAQLYDLRGRCLIIPFLLFFVKRSAVEPQFQRSGILLISKS